ncbi:MAG: hypothetical protein EBT27_09995, partial [Betaproteobacteria bacterium]|nr:hypothetical protein [Betaproteobacteria bacterium]
MNVSGGTFNITSLLAGNYTATITDANGCTANRIFTINQPTQISITNALTHINCFAANTGSSSVTVTGGSAPYNVSWSGPVSGNPAGNEILISGGSYP